MAAAVGCFLRAVALRATTPRHVRWALAGVGIDVLGTIVVLLTQRVLGWHVEPHFPDVALVHRAFAYLVTALLAVVAVSGATRRSWHGKVGAVFLPLYVVTYLLAVWAYAPWW
jgi:drug/metabolite transporter (DMT)-like permease